MKPRRTEYNGICFRSKSEAVFARYLDMHLDEWSQIGEWMNKTCPHIRNLSLGSRGGFEYEPKTLIDGWNPDFLLWEVSPPHGDKDHFFWSIPTVEMTYIEYKPSCPTSTYINEWMNYVEKWVEMARLKSFDCMARTRFKIYYGSIFSSAKRGTIVRYPEGDHDHDEDDWLANEEQELLAYRFDLDQQGVR